jgi:hypothetical protein
VDSSARNIASLAGEYGIEFSTGRENSIPVLRKGDSCHRNTALQTEARVIVQESIDDARCERITAADTVDYDYGQGRLSYDATRMEESGSRLSSGNIDTLCAGDLCKL